MTLSASAGASIPEVTHHHAAIDGADLHYVSAGDTGTPVLLVHGFPESWWAFRRLIPLLAAEHRVVAVDLPGFGDSGHEPGRDYSNAAVARALRGLIEHLGLGPVHLTGQDVGGIGTYRLVATHPELIRSWAGIETALPGFGLEQLIAATWHVQLLGSPGIPELLLAGREREFLTGFALPAMNGTPGAVTDADVDELVRVYAQDGGLRGTVGVYQALLAEADELRALTAQGPIALPVLAVDAGSGAFTSQTLHQVAADVSAVTLDGIGHLVAQEAPDRLADALLRFWRPLDAAA